MEKRVSGVLLSVTSLPSRHGIGDFGKEAYNFVDRLSKTGFSLWQILPLNPIGYGHSPYQPYSSFALDEQFISLDSLTEAGLLSKTPSFLKNETKVHYEDVREFKLKYLYKAYEKDMKLHPNGLKSFILKNPWVKSWGVFSMFHRRYKCSWNEWPDEAKNFFKDNSKLSKEDKKQADFEIWLQKIAFGQWDKLHKYANKKGISIIGDIPFYVGYDSCDVWTNLDCFLINEVTLEPDFIAGVPPDYFSATGQRWGNPIYDWDYLEKTDFAFLQSRILINSSTYDILRLDHFRAFDTYWKIPSSCPTAVEGAWIEAPGYKFFDSLFAKKDGLQEKIIAEDLGDLRPEVLTLRDHYNFPGMNVIEFTFNDFELQHKGNWDETNAVCYLGTHDNQTFSSFFANLSDYEKGEWNNVLASKGIEEDTINKKMEAYCLQKKGKWAILSMQDILDYDDSTRTNVPSTVNDINWTFKLSSFKEFDKALPWLKKDLSISGRKA